MYTIKRETKIILHDLKPKLRIFFQCSDEVHGILECFLGTVKQGSGGGSLAHRVAALLRRYRAARPARAAALLHTHRDIIA